MQSKKTSVVSSLFWADEASWDEVHTCLKRLGQTYGAELGIMRGAAFGMAMRLNLIFPVFDLFCEQVCVDCSGPCCLNALVAFDFADLLLMHALSLEIPPHQIRRHDNEHCRYLGPAGCTLERIRRPFVCTWYYCAPMLELLRERPAREQRRLTGLMSEAQAFRRTMENEFIRVTAGVDLTCDV
jgi:hypothetical protein